MRKKRKQRSRPETSTPLPVNAVPPSRRPTGTFYWGLALGFATALTFTIAMDLGWIPFDGGGKATLAESLATPTPPSERQLLIAGTIPAGAALLVDGHPVEGTMRDGWIHATVPFHAQSVEIRGGTGTWWQASLADAGSDTLRPEWSGEIVVEASSHFSAGTLYLDGQPMGAVPGTVGGIAPGWHVLSVRAGGALIYEDARAIGPGEVVPWTVPAAPPGGKARLVVRSRRMEERGYMETQARPVRVDGRYRGATPLELNVAAGYHSVAIEEPGRPVVVQVLRIDSGSTRYVESQGSPDPELGVEIGRITVMKPDGVLVVPVRIVGVGAPIKTAMLQMVRPQQAETVQVPLLVSASDPQIWVGVIPKSLLTPGEPAFAFASGTDVSGKDGCSEIINLYR